MERAARRKQIEWHSPVLTGLPPSGRYLIGVSGGRDSVALLHWLLGLGYRKLIVCHLDHGLRGRAARADARFVQRLADRLKLPFELKAENVSARAARTKRSIETAARAARYEFFAEVSRRRRCATIFLGHHADDLVETFLFNLFRGTGGTGLVALRDWKEHRVNRVQFTVARPLLSVWREEIDQYVRAHHLTFREDKTNREFASSRNRIRHRVIPYLERTLHRKVRATLWRTAMIVAEEESWMATAARAEVEFGQEVEVAKLRSLPLALRRRAILAWLREQGIREVGYEEVERVLGLLKLEAGPAKVNLAADRHARRRAGKLFIE
jgi:tRNA(Ile)-lysidine synthase